MIAMHTYFEMDDMDHILSQAAIWGAGTGAATKLSLDRPSTFEDDKKNKKKMVLASLAGAATGAAGAVA